MKKGRPAHTLHVLVHPSRAAQVRDAVFEHTSAIGLREQVVTKHALDRRDVTVEVDGHPVRVKVAGREGRVLNVQPEWEDVAAAALALGVPAKTVLARAVSAVPRHDARPAQRPRRLTTGRPQPLTTLDGCRPPSCASSSRC